MKLNILLCVTTSCLVLSSTAAAQDAARPVAPATTPDPLEINPMLLRQGSTAGHEAVHRGLSAGKLDVAVADENSLWSWMQPGAFQLAFASLPGTLLRWSGLDALDPDGNLAPLSALHSQIVESCERWFGLAAKAAPAVRMRVSSKFGMRFHPILKKWQMHNGVDFASPTGTPVYAAADGVVKAAGWAGPAGKLVLIKHADGYVTGYAHLHKIMPGIIPGATVTSYDVIGQVGTTGRSTGPHLHFTLRKDGKYIDPLNTDFQYEHPIQRASALDVAYRKEIRPFLLALLSSGDATATR